MDELFISSTDKISGLEEAEVEEVEDVDERTALLFRQRERERRRSSFAGLNWADLAAILEFRHALGLGNVARSC